MSVILTGMDMPEGCFYCNLLACGKTYSGCPLKSVDGLIEKIQSEVVRSRDYNTKLNQESDYYSTPEIQNVSGNIKGLLKAIAIIKEYCEVE